MKHTRPADRQREEGVALILGILFTVLVVGITVSGSLILRSHQTKTKTNFVLHGQAMQFARSGLTDALGWLRKQTSQPVGVFAPQLDPTADPPVLETDDEDVGIAREFAVSGAIWGRYEIWKPWDLDPIAERLAWRQQMQVDDISRERLLPTAGSVWKLRSLGYVFRRVDPALPFDQMPNQVLGREMLEVEVRRLSLQPPGQAALSIPDGNSAHINTKGRILGGATGAGIFYPQGSGTPTTGPASENRVTGNPPLAPSTTYNGSVEEVFGASLDQLRTMANQIITDPNDFPSPVPSNAIIIVDAPNINFDAARPLNGTAIVVIMGNCAVLQGSNSNFSGMLYIDGSFTLRDPSEIKGAVVVNGNMTAQGSFDYATIMFDDDVLNSLRREIGNYRMSSPITRPHAQEYER